MVHGARGGIPRYVQIASQIRADIAHGRYAIGDRIPSEPEVRDEYAVSKTTADAALRLLAAEGWVQRRTGAGSFVVKVPAVTEIKVPAGAVIMARPVQAGDGAAVAPGLAPALYVLVVTAPDGTEQVYPAYSTVLRT